MTKVKFPRTAAIAMALSVVLTSMTLLSATAANFHKSSATSITESKNSGKNGGRHMLGLSKLVEDEVITQEQADAITSVMTTAKEEGTQVGLASVLAALVEDGTISQDEADAITEAMPERTGAGQKGGRRMLGLSKLVEDEVITQEQADAITSATEAAKEEGTRVCLDSLLPALVEEGVITQDEADAITEAMPEHKNSK